MKYRLSIYFLCSVSSIWMLSIWVGAVLRAEPESGAPPSALVQVEPVQGRRITPFSWMPGIVLSRNESRIASELEGRLQQVAEVGAFLQKGGIVAKIEERRFRLRVDQVQAELEEFRPDLEFYRKETVRLTRLAMENNAAKSQLDEVTARRDALEWQLKSAQARLQLAEEDLSKVFLRTPFAGVVTERLRMPGEQVQLGDAVVRVVDTDHLEVRARVAASGMASLEIGDQLQVRDREGMEHSGQIRALVPVGDASHLYEIRIALEDAPWPAGWPTRVAVPDARPRDALLVPRDALVIRSFGISIFVVDGQQRARMVPVHTGYAEQDWIEVQGELKVGDSVVVRGNERLIPGQPVQIQERRDARSQ